MRILVVMAVTVSWMQLSVQGKARPSTRDQLDWGLERTASLLSKRTEEVDLDFNGDPSGDKYVRNMLKVIFEMKEWRDLMVTFATTEELANPAFRAKWHITDNDIVGDNNKKYSERVRDQLRRLLRSRKWRGLIALSSAKADLIDATYREKWGLGPLESNVKYSSENGNFFQSPQWKQFLAITETNKEFPDPQARAKWLRKWILSTMAMMSEYNN